MKTTDLTRVGLLLALLVVSAQFAIPFGPVAISLQTLVVLTIGLSFSTRQAVLTTSLYLLLGLIGLPVFTQGMGGIHSVFLPSFGFLLSFTPAVWVMSKIQGSKKNQVSTSFIALLVGNMIIYAIGITYLAFILNGYLGNEMSFWKILSIGMLPFIPGDIFKSIIALGIARKLTTYLDKRS